MEKIENAKTLPKVYYGLHMVEGVAEYKEPTINNGMPYRIFVGENCIRNMDATFAGRPLYVRHVDDVDLDKIQEQADGYVVESFFNKADGKHWAKFIVVSDRGHEAIRSGWKLSNAYLPKKFSGGGLWHGVEYLKEVEEGEYEHLALVPNPRYEESIILTPEEFKNYNNQKEIELKKLSNSKTKGAKSMFNFFKKSKVENTADFDDMVVVLPKSKTEKTITQIINEADEAEMKNQEEEEAKNSEEQPMANMEHYVKANGKTMKLADCMKHYQSLCEKHENEEEEAQKNEDEPKENDETAKDKVLEHEAEEEKVASSADEMAENMDDKEALAKTLELAEHEVEEMRGQKANKKKNSAHFEALKNAEKNSYKMSPVIELSQDKVARGKARYGSN